MHVARFLWVLLLSAGWAVAEIQTPHQKYAGQAKMNGHSFEEFKDFEKNWHLVTVRFRKDTNEMRWTFANDLAWRSLEKGLVNYPDGAVFAKVGIVTSEDPQFPSSAVPLGARRYQFMVRDKNLHSSTGGWGYALFDVNGKTFPEEPKATAMACYACHRVVENRGQVFSQPFQFAPHLKGTYFSSHRNFRKLEFVTVLSGKLAPDIATHVGASWKSVRDVSDEPMRKNLFQGTLDEIRPALEREAHEQRRPALLRSSDQTRFSLVLPISKEGCKEGRSFRSVVTTAEKKGEAYAVKILEYCNP